MSIIKNYLTEVSYIDGSTEFKTYTNKEESWELPFNLELGLTSISIELGKLGSTIDNIDSIDDDSINIIIENRNDIPVYIKNVTNKSMLFKEIYVTEGNTFLPNDKLKVQYVALNESISNLYSVDYDNGVLYLSAEPNIQLEIEYSYYNILVSGKKAIQLNDDEYTVSDTDSTINNYKNNVEYEAIYSIEKNSQEAYRTPVISNIKLNYINTSESESL